MPRVHGHTGSRKLLGDLVLRRKWIGSAERDVGATGHQCPYQDAGLSRHMKRQADPNAGKRKLARKPTRNPGKHRHLTGSPLDPSHSPDSQ